MSGEAKAHRVVQVPKSYFWNRLRANKEDSRAWALNNMYRPYFVRVLKPLIKLKQFFKKPINE